MQELEGHVIVWMDVENFEAYKESVSHAWNEKIKERGIVIQLSFPLDRVEIVEQHEDGTIEYEII